MTVLGDADRLVQLLCQLDQEGPTAEVALRRVREHLKRHGQKFVDLANVVADSADTGTRTADAMPQETKASSADDKILHGPFIHQPLAKGLFPFRPKTVHGKPVVRGQRPPPGTRIRLRVLSQDEIDGVVKFKCSGESGHEIYEPFDLYAEVGSRDHESIVLCSCNGITLVM